MMQAEPSPAIEAAHNVLRSKPMVTAIGLILLFKLAFLVLYAVNTTYVMDELGQLTIASHAHEGFHRGFPSPKTVLAVSYFSLAFHLSEHAVTVLTVARLQGLLVALLTLLLVFLTLRRLGHAGIHLLVGLAFVLFFSEFIERSYRVRTDCVALMFAMAALWVAVGGARSLRRAALAGVLLGLAFLSTQKAIYFVAAYAAGQVVAAVVHRAVPRMLAVGTVAASGFCAAIALYALWFGGGDPTVVLRQIFIDVRQVATASTDFVTGFERFTTNTLVRNVAPYLLCVAGVVLQLARVRRLRQEELLALVFSCTIAVLVLLHREPWPYIFPWAQVPLALWAPAVIRRLGALSRRWLAQGLVGLALLGCSISFVRNADVLQRSNDIQRHVVAFSERLLGPGDSYCDGVGMVPTRTLAGETWWDLQRRMDLLRAAQANQHGTMDALMAQEPKLWILNYRVNHVWPAIVSHLRNGYVRVHPNVLLAGAAPLRPGKQLVFNCPWSGEYALYGEDGRPSGGQLLVDGRAVGPTVRLRRGSHRLRLLPAAARASAADGPTRLLFPSGLRLPQLPVRQPPLRLYPGVYQ